MCVHDCPHGPRAYSDGPTYRHYLNISATPVLSRVWSNNYARCCSRLKKRRCGFVRLNHDGEQYIAESSEYSSTINVMVQAGWRTVISPQWHVECIHHTQVRRNGVLTWPAAVSRPFMTTPRAWQAVNSRDAVRQSDARTNLMEVYEQTKF